MHGFEAVTNVRQCPAHYDTHRIVEVGLPHFVFQIGGQCLSGEGRFCHWEAGKGEEFPTQGRLCIGSMPAVDRWISGACCLARGTTTLQACDPSGRYLKTAIFQRCILPQGGGFASLLPPIRSSVHRGPITFKFLAGFQPTLILRGHENTKQAVSILIVVFRPDIAASVELGPQRTCRGCNP